MSGWIGVDLDGTLAEYHGWIGPESIGNPIQPMVERVKRWLSKGKDVRIFTARAWPLGIATEVLENLNVADIVERRRIALRSTTAIQQWCKEHIGKVLPITCIKDHSMYELWDDRAVSVIPNTGVSHKEKLEALERSKHYHPEHDHE